MRVARVVVGLVAASVSVVGVSTPIASADTVVAKCTPDLHVQIKPGLTPEVQTSKLTFSGSVGGPDCPLGPGAVSGVLKPEGQASCGSVLSGTIWKGRLTITWADTSVSTLKLKSFGGDGGVPVLMITVGKVASGTYAGDRFSARSTRAIGEGQDCKNVPITSFTMPGDPASTRRTRDLTFFAEDS